MSGPTIKPVGVLCLKCGRHAAPEDWHYSHDEHTCGGQRQRYYDYAALEEAAGAAAVRAGFHGDVKAFAKTVVEQLTGVKQ